jgi:hypothetical protein
VTKEGANSGTTILKIDCVHKDIQFEYPEVDRHHIIMRECNLPQLVPIACV